MSLQPVRTSGGLAQRVEGLARILQEIKTVN